MEQFGSPTSPLRLVQGQVNRKRQAGNPFSLPRALGQVAETDRGWSSVRGQGRQSQSRDRGQAELQGAGCIHRAGCRPEAAGQEHFGSRPDTKVQGSPGQCKLQGRKGQGREETSPGSQGGDGGWTVGGQKTYLRQTRLTGVSQVAAGRNYAAAFRCVGQPNTQI